jgi:hypothetical protein
MKLAAGIVGFMGGAGVLAMGMATMRGALIPGEAAWALVGGGVIGLLAMVDAPAGPRRRWGWADGLLAVAFALFSIRSFAWLAYWSGDAIRFGSAYNLGDLSLHITLIEHLASGAAFWPDNPIFPGTPIRYPIGVDLLNAAMVAAGADLIRSLAWVGFAGSLAMFLALRRFGGAFLVAAFLFNGGLAGFDFFRTLVLSEYQSELAWKCIPLTMFVPQRGLLYAFPAGLLLLASWRARFFEAEIEPDERPLPAWLELFLYATMPLFHAHTFVFLSAILAGFVFFVGRRGFPWLFGLIGLALLPATALIHYVVGFGDGTSGIHWKPGWMQDPAQPVLFWVMNFGATSVLALVLVGRVAARIRKNRVAAAFVLPSFLVFVAACFVMLNRWEWDNTKIMVWCYLVLMAFLWREVLGSLAAWARVAACFLLFVSGAVSLAGGLGPRTLNFLLIERSELDGVRKAVKPLPLNATFAAASECNHPLLLSGRKCLVGYTGHLWSYAIPYEERYEKLRLVMLGREKWRETASELGADFLFWGRFEEKVFAGSPQPWRGVYPVVSSGAWGTIYDLREDKR